MATINQNAVLPYELLTPAQAAAVAFVPATQDYAGCLAAIKAAIAAHHPDVPVYIYEGSGHGFNNDGVPAQDPADAKLARERTLAFFLAQAG